MQVKYNKIIGKLDYYIFVFPSMKYSPLQHVFLTHILWVFIFQTLNLDCHTHRGPAPWPPYPILPPTSLGPSDNIIFCQFHSCILTPLLLLYMTPLSRCKPLSLSLNPAKMTNAFQLSPPGYLHWQFTQSRNTFSRVYLNWFYGVFYNYSKSPVQQVICQILSSQTPQSTEMKAVPE